MVTRIDEFESIDSLIFRFRRQVNRSGVLKRYREKQAFASKGEIKRLRAISQSKRGRGRRESF